MVNWRNLEGSVKGLFRGRSLKAIVLACQSSATSLTGILIAAYLSRVLTKVELGTYRQVMLPSTVFQPIVVLGLPLSLLYFISTDRQNSRSILSTNQFVLLILGAVWASFLYFGGFQLFAASAGNSELRQYVLAAALLGFTGVLTAGFAQCLFAIDRHIEAAGIQLAFVVVNFLAVIGAFLVYRTIWSLLVAQVVVAILFVPIKIGMMFWRTHGQLNLPSFNACREQIVHGADLGFAMMLGTIHKQMDKFLVAIFSNVENYAVFTNGARELPFVGIVQGSVTSVILPDMAKSMADEDFESAHALWVRAIKKVAPILFSITAIGLCFSGEIVTLVFSKAYVESRWVFAIYLLLLPLRCISYGSVCIAAGRNDLVRKGAFIGLVANIVLSCLLIYIVGYLGVAVATVASTALVVIPYYLFHIARIFEVTRGDLLPWRFLTKQAAMASVLFCFLALAKQSSTLVFG